MSFIESRTDFILPDDVEVKMDDTRAREAVELIKKQKHDFTTFKLNHVAVIDSLKTIKENTEKMNDVVNQMLDLLQMINRTNENHYRETMKFKTEFLEFVKAVEEEELMADPIEKIQELKPAPLKIEEVPIEVPEPEPIITKVEQPETSPKSVEIEEQPKKKGFFSRLNPFGKKE